VTALPPRQARFCPIYFTLADGASRSEESTFGILAGQQTWDSKAVLKEFALCYPDGTIEHVTKSGSRKFNMWANTRIGESHRAALLAVQTSRNPSSVKFGSIPEISGSRAAINFA